MIEPSQRNYLDDDGHRVRWDYEMLWADDGPGVWRCCVECQHTPGEIWTRTSVVSRDMFEAAKVDVESHVVETLQMHVRAKCGHGQ